MEARSRELSHRKGATMTTHSSGHNTTALLHPDRLYIQWLKDIIVEVKLEQRDHQFDNLFRVLHKTFL